MSLPGMYSTARTGVAARLSKLPSSFSRASARATAMLGRIMAMASSAGTMLYRPLMSGL